MFAAGRLVCCRIVITLHIPLLLQLAVVGQCRGNGCPALFRCSVGAAEAGEASPNVAAARPAVSEVAKVVESQHVSRSAH